MRSFRTITVVLAMLLVADSADACVVRYRDASELKSEAALVVQAIVLSREVNGESQLGELYSYEVQMKAIERGVWGVDEPMTVTYYNLRAREHNGKVDCPIKDGSGRETHLEIGHIYRFFLKSKGETEILFSEELSERLSQNQP